MARAWQALLIGSTLAYSWLAMMVVHEFGHCLHLWFSGGSVGQVVLHPLVISRTDPHDNPHPLFVAWGGAVWGCLLPVLGWAAANVVRWRFWYLARFFAGFCLIANGAYLLLGAFDPVGDARDLLRLGAPRWTLQLFGIVAWGLGLALWHRLGPHFGLNQRPPQVDRAAALAVTVALVLLIAAELIWGRSE
ncbi:MAG: hypothetical protein JNM56_13535 [Planctomycetia bacterium]|nr:hypothetical protein [Planctomycetia bacterium]